MTFILWMKKMPKRTTDLICLSTGKDLDDPNRMLYTKQEWMKTREEMNEIFADVPEALVQYTWTFCDKVEYLLYRPRSYHAYFRHSRRLRNGRGIS